MITLNRIAVLCLVFAGTVAATELDSEQDRTSYAYGAMAAMNMQLAGVPLDIEIVLQAMRDVLEKNAPAMTQQAIFDTINRSRAARNQRVDPASPEAEAHRAAGREFLATNGKREGVITTASGLQYEVLQAGSGPRPGPADTIEAHYTGTLVDGTQFDSSHDRGQPARFRVDQVIKGWTEALQLMPVGSTWKLYIPPELAYGPRQVGKVIKPHSVLVFEVELLGVK